ncbi:MAG: electron transfer flavoprotein subunit alpha/FixB family protein [Marinilabiliales bacterium]
MAVLIYTENWDGKFKKSSFELISFGAKIAELKGTECVALSIGKVEDSELKLLAKYGANKIVSVQKDELNILDNKAYTQVISSVADAINADIIVFTHNNTGKALAPRLAAKQKAGYVSGVIDIPSSVEPFVIKKKAFTGGAIANVKVNSPKVVVTLAQNSFEIIEKDTGANIEPFELQVGEVATKVLDVNKVTGKILLTDAEIVVSGGRGMKSPDNWGPLEELASVLGAGLACSRPVSDEGWRPHEEHVGQTGKIIAPNLYLAFGISGAIQHLGGVSSSKCIVAVNIDKDAPIFEAADYGIVGDVKTVIPAMIEAFKAIK